jgi:DNA-damage-inducible protein J
MDKDLKEGVVTVKMDKELKKTVQEILENLGLNQSIAIQMLFKQIALKKKLPFEVSLVNSSRQIKLSTKSKSKK